MAKRLTLTLLSSLAIAACGSSAGHPTTDAAKGYPAALAFSKCMRAHGVSNFPDPGSSGGGVQIAIGPQSGVNPRAPAFQAAQKACRHLLPGGGPGSGPPSPQARAQMLRISECMRAHGISGFPDPTTRPPTSPDGYGVVMGHNGMFLAIPDSINPQSPAFEQAAAACHFGPGGKRLSTG